MGGRGRVMLYINCREKKNVKCKNIYKSTDTSHINVKE